MPNTPKPDLALTRLARIVNLLHRVSLTHPCGLIEDHAPAPVDTLTVSQVSAIGYLFLQDGKDVYQKDLEHFFKLRRSTVSSMLNTMEKKGVLRREPVAHDARLKKIVLTNQGRQLSGTVTQYFTHINEQMVRGLTPEEIAFLLTILTKIENNLTQAEDTFAQAQREPQEVTP